MQKARAMSATQLYTLMEERFDMRGLLLMARPANEILEPMAVRKPSQVKLSSLALATATPTMTGKRER